MSGGTARQPVGLVSSLLPGPPPLPVIPPPLQFPSPHSPRRLHSLPAPLLFLPTHIHLSLPPKSSLLISFFPSPHYTYYHYSSILSTRPPAPLRSISSLLSLSLTLTFSYSSFLVLLSSHIISDYFSSCLCTCIFLFSRPCCLASGSQEYDTGLQLYLIQLPRHI